MSTSSPPRTRWSTSKRSHSSPAFACRIHTRSPTRRSPPEQRRLHLARAFARVEPEPGGRAREPVAAGGAGGRVAAAERGRHARRGPAHDREREERGGTRGEGAVGVEQGGGEQPGARCDLGDGRLGRGLLDRAGAAAVDVPQRRDLLDRLHDGGAAIGQLARRGALHAPDRGAQQSIRRGRSPTPAICASYIISPSSRSPRPTISRASAAAACGVCSGERRAPMRTRPPSGRQLASTSIHTRSGPSSRSRCSRQSTITAAFSGAAASARRAARSVVGYATTTSSASSHSASRSVNASVPRRPAACALAASARQRTDFDASRTGLPRARRSRSAALASNASRSTAAKGGSRCSVAASQRMAHGSDASRADLR